MGKPLFVRCMIATTVAVELGMAESGEYLVPFTEELLAPLTAEERAVLALFVTTDRESASTSRLELTERPSWEAALQVVRVRIAKETAEKVERARVRVGAAERVLGLDPEAVMGESYSDDAEALRKACGGFYSGQGPQYIRDGQKPDAATDPRVLDWLSRARTAHRMRAETEAVERRVAEAKAQVESDRRKAENERRAEAAKAAESAREEALAAWAMLHSARYRAGSVEGYPMQGVARQALDAYLAEQFAPSVVIEAVPKNAYKPRSDVAELALTLLQSVRVSAANATDLPQGVALEVGPIARHAEVTHSDVCLDVEGDCIEDEDGGCGTTYRTIIPVYVRGVAGGDRVVIVPAE